MFIKKYEMKYIKEVGHDDIFKKFNFIKSLDDGAIIEAVNPNDRETIAWLEKLIELANGYVG